MERGKCAREPHHQNGIWGSREAIRLKCAPTHHVFTNTSESLPETGTLTLYCIEQTPIHMLKTFLLCFLDEFTLSWYLYVLYNLLDPIRIPSTEPKDQTLRLLSSFPPQTTAGQLHQTKQQRLRDTFGYRTVPTISSYLFRILLFLCVNHHPKSCTTTVFNQYRGVTLGLKIEKVLIHQSRHLQMQNGML